MHFMCCLREVTHLHLQVCCVDDCTRWCNLKWNDWVGVGGKLFSSALCQNKCAKLGQPVLQSTSKLAVIYIMVFMGYTFNISHG